MRAGAGPDPFTSILLGAITSIAMGASQKEFNPLGAVSALLAPVGVMAGGGAFSNLAGAGSGAGLGSMSSSFGKDLAGMASETANMMSDIPGLASTAMSPVMSAAPSAFDTFGKSLQNGLSLAQSPLEQLSSISAGSMFPGGGAASPEIGGYSFGGMDAQGNQLPTGGGSNLTNDLARGIDPSGPLGLDYMKPDGYYYSAAGGRNPFAPVAPEPTMTKEIASGGATQASSAPSYPAWEGVPLKDVAPYQKSAIETLLEGIQKGKRTDMLMQLGGGALKGVLVAAMKPETPEPRMVGRTRRLYPQKYRGIGAQLRAKRAY